MQPLFVWLVDLVIAEVFQISFISFVKYGFCFWVYLMTVSSFLILLKEVFNLYFVCIYFYKMHSKTKRLDFVFWITVLFIYLFILLCNFLFVFFFLFLYFSCVPHLEPSSLLPPHTIPLGRPSVLNYFVWRMLMLLGYKRVRYNIVTK